MNEDGSLEKEKYQMHMKSEHGEIEVFLCPEDESPPSSSPPSLSPSHSAFAPTSPSASFRSAASPYSSPNGRPQRMNKGKNRNQKHSYNQPSITQLIGGFDDDEGSFQLETMDQNQPEQAHMGIDISSMATIGCSESLLSLEPPLSDNDYTFTMDDAEGISTLFDCPF